MPSPTTRNRREQWPRAQKASASRGLDGGTIWCCCVTIFVGRSNLANGRWSRSRLSYGGNCLLVDVEKIAVIHTPNAEPGRFPKGVEIGMSRTKFVEPYELACPALDHFLVRNMKAPVRCASRKTQPSGLGDLAEQMNSRETHA